MRLLKVRLTNACQFRNLEFELSPGLNAVVGRNGRGKSNVMKMVFGALTNDFGRNPGRKEDNVSNRAGPRELAEVQVLFEHRGATYDLTRGLRPAKQTLLVPGESPVTADSAVNARVQQILGVGPEVLDKYVFVDQLELFSFLTTTATERAKAFARLFGTQDAEAAWKAASEEANRTRVPQTAADLDERRAALAAARATEAAIRQGLDRFAGLPERPAPTDDDQALQDARRHQQLRADVLAHAARKQEAATALARLRRERLGFEEDLARLGQGFSGSEAGAAAARAAIANWRTLQQVAQTRARIENQLANALAEEATNLRPAPRNGLHLSAGEFQQAQYDVEHLAAKVRSDEAFLRSFEPAKGVAACPTCHTPVQTLAPVLEAARAALPGLKAQLAHLQQRLQYTREHDRAQQAYDQWLAGWTPRVRELERHLAELQTVPRPDRTEAELQAVVATHADLEAAVRDVERELGAIGREEAAQQALVGAAEQAIRAAEAEGAALRVVSPEDLVEVERRIAERTVAFAERARLRGELQAQTRAVADLRAAVDRLEADQAEARRLAGVLTHLTQVAGVLHRDNLPRLVAQEHLRRLEGQTNTILADFLAPFRAETAEDLSFRAIFHDGAEQPAGRLSVGEKTVLALGFRLSVNSTFAQDVGLLCLDEPTVGLDEHNLGCLRTALERLRAWSSARGLQVVMVTHERSLMPLFDRVIDLDAL